jgi:hypothetical protein
MTRTEERLRNVIKIHCCIIGLYPGRCEQILWVSIHNIHYTKK